MSIFEDTAPRSPRPDVLRVAILGCTGSIGSQALDVCRQHTDRIKVSALAVNTSVAGLAKAAHEFDVRHVAIADAARKDAPEIADLPSGCEVGFGEEAVNALVDLPDIDCVLVCVVGEAGIGASWRTLKAGRILAIANKEPLVSGGDLLMPLARPGMMLPVDSEHSAIFQCLVGERRSDVHAIWLTCSGGPFLGRSREELASVTPAEALAHPSWSMGPKITIDSATLMNKGLEVIEAHHLFGVSVDDVRVVIHPQSRIHSMVEFSDGSVKAQLGPSDMRLPIQYAFSYPERWETPAPRVDYREIPDLTFTNPDEKAFRCLSLAIEAGRTGGTLPCAMNAANEVANAAFRAGRCSFTDIDAIVETVMDQTSVEVVSSLQQLSDVDGRARSQANMALEEVIS